MEHCHLMGFRKRSAPILAVSLAFLLVPGSAYAAAAAPVDSNAGQAITQAESASPATVVVASGAATTTSGSAVRDAVIDLYAWPSDKVLQALTFGQEVPRTLVATATADSAGKFSLSLAPDTLSAHAASSGFVNLEADSGTATWFFPTDAAKPAATTIRLTGASTKHVTDSFTYSRGQSSSLGVGFSPTGKQGTFTADGTVSTSSTASQGFPAEGPGNTLFMTYFKAGVYHDGCGTPGKGKPDRPGAGSQQRWRVLSNGWAGGDKIEHPRITPAADHCVPEVAGSTFQTSNERAVTWSGGFSIPILGFNGQAQTGYDTSAQLSFVFGADGNLCGTNDDPPVAAQVVAEKLSSANAPQVLLTGCPARSRPHRLHSERLRDVGRIPPWRASRPARESVDPMHAGQPGPRGYRRASQCHQQQRWHTDRRWRGPRPAARHQAGRRVPHAGRRRGGGVGYLPAARRPGVAVPRLVEARSGGRCPYPAGRDHQHHPRDRANDHDRLQHLRRRGALP